MKNLDLANMTMREKEETIVDYVEEIKSLVGKDYVPVLYYYSGEYEDEDLNYDLNLLETIIYEIMQVDEAIKNMNDIQLRRIEKILHEKLHGKDRRTLNDYLFNLVAKEFFSDEQERVREILNIDECYFI